MLTKSKLRKFRVHYTDESDEACPIFSYVTRAYDIEHVEMKFFESDDSEGWKIVSIESVLEVS